jgi:hypothetical protein
LNNFIIIPGIARESGGRVGIQDNLMLLIARLLWHDDGASAESLNESIKKGNNNYLARTFAFRISEKLHRYFLRNAKQAPRHWKTPSNLQGKVMLIFGTPSALCFSRIMKMRETNIISQGRR